MGQHKCDWVRIGRNGSEYVRMVRTGESRMGWNGEYGRSECVRN